MSCRVAVLDIGSQTIRLVGAEIHEKCLRILFSHRVNARLGQGLMGNGFIGKKAMKRAWSALEKFREVIDDFSIDHVRAIGTAALRKASNRAQFIEHAKEIGIDIEVIDWNQEAELAVLGAYNAIGDVESPWTMIDVGGGSSEIAFCTDNKLLYGISLDIGAVSLLESISQREVIDVDLLANMAKRIVSKGLAKVPVPHAGLKVAVGTGGTATTIAAVDLQLGVYDPHRVRGHAVSISRLRYLLSSIGGLDLKKRRQVKGLEQERADIFPAGIAILTGIISYLGLNKIIISDGGLLSGLLAAFMQKECNFYVEPSCARSIYL